MDTQKNTRLIIVQGPIQLLNVLSILRYQFDRGEFIDSDDYLIIGGLASKFLETQKLKRICIKLANSLWDFKKIFYLNEWFRRLHNRNYLSFKNCTKCIKQFTRIYEANVIYTARNWQFINEIFLSSYPEAQKICYGDALGWIDVRTNSQEYESLNPDGFQEVDRFYSIIPALDHEVSYFDIVQKTKLVDPRFFVSVINDATDKTNSLDNWLAKLKFQAEGSLILVLTANHTASGLTLRIQDEIDCYLNCVLPESNHHDLILVKRYPRQGYNQAKRLVKTLRQNGRKAIEIRKLNHWPVELFIKKLNPAKIIFCASSSCMGSALLINQKQELIIGYGEELIKKYIAEKHQKDLMHNEYERYFITQKIIHEPQTDQWDLNQTHLMFKTSISTSHPTSFNITFKGLSH